jgi:universal stress protein A
MSVYQHILTAIDFGDSSATVLQQASALARLCEAKLTVVHVVNYSPSPNTGSMSPPVDEAESKLTDAARNQLQELLQKEALSEGVATIITSGKAKVEIARIAEQENADLLVVGAHVSKGLSGIFGSTTSSVLDQAKCNVLVVR